MSEKPVTVERIKSEYKKMVDYNTGINLYENVKMNENFFIGKQWENVEANGLPTPVFNFLKRVTLFTVASITSDNIKMKASSMAASPIGGLPRAASIINNEFDRLFEFGKIPNKMREVMRNAAVDGDGVTYTYWNADVETGQPRKGAIVTEVIENTRIGFGNTADRRVQTQPYILITHREMTDMLKDRAGELGCGNLDSIKPDTDDTQPDAYKDLDQKTTVILRLWKNRETGTVWACEATQDVMIRRPWDLGIRLYPITWLNWDYIQDNYHGQAMIGGLIPNQVFINKMFAMSMLSMMTTAFPKVLYDGTRVKSWSNQVGTAIKVTGGDVNSVAKILDPATISPQISQFIELAVDMTQSNLGATSVALGDTRPDNTSAIIALQRAAATPNEITKQNLYECIEDLGRIYIEFMAGYYGVRNVEADPPTTNELPPEIQEFAADSMPLNENGKIVLPFDFSALKGIPMSLKLDVGASSYWSEIASVQTLDNLLMNKVISGTVYLKHLPEGYLADRQGIINDIQAEMARVMVTPPGEQPQSDGTGVAKDNTPIESIPVRGGAGNGELQRKLQETL